MTTTLTPTPTAAIDPVVTKKTRKKVPSVGWMIGTAWLVTLAFCAFFADYLPFIRTYDAKVLVNGRAKKYGLGPGWTAWFGTDNSSHDVFARCIYGARQTLIIGIGATIIGLVIGGLLGVLGGYYRGWADRGVSILVDCLLALPALLLALLLIQRSDQIKDTITWLGWLTRTEEIMITLGILSIAPFARIVRAQNPRVTRTRLRVGRAQRRGAEPSRDLARDHAQPRSGDGHGGRHRPRHPHRRRGHARLPRARGRATADMGQDDRRGTRRSRQGLVGRDLPVPLLVPHGVELQLHRRSIGAQVRHP